MTTEMKRMMLTSKQRVPTAHIIHTYLQIIVYLPSLTLIRYSLKCVTSRTSFSSKILRTNLTMQLGNMLVSQIQTKHIKQVLAACRRLVCLPAVLNLESYSLAQIIVPETDTPIFSFCHLGTWRHLCNRGMKRMTFHLGRYSVRSFKQYLGRL